MAASVLGAAEIAYHAQSLPLFPILGVTPPVLFPRTHFVLRGPAERRLAEQLGIAEADLLAAPAEAPPPVVPEADAAAALAQSTDAQLAALEASLAGLDASLSGALDTARKKIAYQFEQLAERTRKAVERKSGVASNRAIRLAQALMPGRHPGRARLSPARLDAQLGARHPGRAAAGRRPLDRRRGGRRPRPRCRWRRPWPLTSSRSPRTRTTSS